MVAKRFFYVSAALLCLALAYHLGAVNAEGQTPSFRILNHGVPFVAVGETVYTLDAVGGWHPYTNNTYPPVPVSSLVVLGGSFAITQAGEGWVCNGNTGVWTSYGAIPGGGTSAQQQSWGQVKARYR